jgi:hypothetical protein
LLRRVRMLASLTPRRRLVLAVLALSAVVALVCARLNTAGDLGVAGAQTHVLVDTPSPSLAYRDDPVNDPSALQMRAELYARMFAARAVLEKVARRAGIPADRLSGAARTPGVPYTFTQPDSEERASQILDARAPYRLEAQASAGEPVLAVYAQAPTPAAAARLADAAVLGLQDYLRALARRQHVAVARLPVLRTLGPPRAAVISSHGALIVGAFTFVTAFGVTAALLFGLVALARRRRPRELPARGEEEPSGDDWPHTSRALPWMLAAFVAMLWLTPFDNVQLSFSTPIDLKLDRIVLPFIVAVWALAFAAGPKLAPRLRLTPIHVALGLFLACAFLSVVLDARALNHTLELDLPLKKLPLLISYMSIFVIMASAVRRSEVRAFMTYSLVLAVICAVGIIWQYRFNQNPFATWTARLLPPGFVYEGSFDPSAAVDSLGRRGITGPAQVSLEAVSMLAMALPIAVVGVLGAKRRKEQVLYAIAICLLTAAMFATVRKSAMLAPVSVIATLAYFRRRELLSLAPLGLVVAVVVSLLSPGAVHETIAQFVEPNSANVATTRDRVSDYDAIRPDVWTHLLFGRGYGSYDHDTYRVLDSEVLDRLVENGVVGLLAFLLIGVSVVAVARRTIASRDGPYAGLALIGAAAAVCFLVVATLFDVLAYPHVTYIFLYIAGLTAVVVRRPEAAAGRARRPVEHGGRRHAPPRKIPALRGVR